MDKIIEALGDKRNDEFYIEHPVCSKYFTLKREDGRSKITAKSKKYIYQLKNRSKQRFILSRKNRWEIIKKKLKNRNMRRTHFC